MPTEILRVEDLHVEYRSDNGVVCALNGMNFSLFRGEIAAVVGESGCGKTSMMDAIMGVLPNGGRVTGGRVLLLDDSGDEEQMPEFIDLLTASPEKQAEIRGKIGVVFQDSVTALNPMLTAGEHLVEVVRSARGCSRAEAEKRAMELLSLVEVDNPAARFRECSHQFSGGLRQRIVIAMTLAKDPRILIADECTSSLDVTVQAEILDLLCDLRDRCNLSIIYITHDFGIVSRICDKVTVVYGGRVCGRGTPEDLFYRNAHPYAKGLVDSLPSFFGTNQRLTPFPGQFTEFSGTPKGCALYTRCPRALDKCKENLPDETEISPGHYVACFNLYK
ncbi:MAG: ABC transporter ATP-binding protein [Oscillospiraceae bacterium]|nr:ABC transporter ATP-binding protein [Oscillospiraceae bacterium]